MHTPPTIHPHPPVKNRPKTQTIQKTAQHETHAVPLGDLPSFALGCTQRHQPMEKATRGKQQSRASASPPTPAKKAGIPSHVVPKAAELHGDGVGAGGGGEAEFGDVDDEEEKRQDPLPPPSHDPQL